MEARVYAEDPLRNFLPSIGKLVTYKEPEGPGIRVDSGVLEGSEISIFYDPLISKLVTYGKNRTEAIEQMKEALDTYIIRGLNHNVNFLRDVLLNNRYCSGNITTKFIPEEYPSGFKGHVLTPEQSNQLLLITASIHYLRQCRDQSISDNVIVGKEYVIVHDAKETPIKISSIGSYKNKIFECTLPNIDPIRVDLSSYQIDGLVIKAKIAESQIIAQLYKISDLGYNIQLYGTVYSLKVLSPNEASLVGYMKEPVKLNTQNYVLSPMPGTLISVAVKVGDHVHVGQEVAIVEAMKMQNILRSSRDAVVKTIPATSGKSVSLDEIIIEFEPHIKIKV